ncbi:MAG TPA: tape measure protein, partial [Burkholderiaceae bacterium]
MAAEVTQLVLAVDSRQVQQASAELKKFGQAGTVAERQSKSLEQSALTLRRAFLGLGAALSIREVVQYADGYQQVNSRLKLVTSTAADFSRVQGELIQQAEQTRSSLTGTIDLYSRVARATRDLNVANTDRLRFTEAINKALIVSGASGASAQAAIIQLGQALASGVVRGEEFNSISEQAPRILEGVAKSLGKTTGELRAMAAQGELTASVFFNAFLGSADGIDREFQRIPVTIGQALVVAESRLQQFIGGTSELTGAGRAVAATIDTLSANIDVLTAAAGGFASAKLAQVLIGVGVAAKANLAATAANIAAQKAQAAATIDAARAELVRAQAVQAAAVMDGVQAREKIASMQASQAAIVVARAETVATIQSTQATLASAQAQLAAAKAAGALSFAIAQRNAAEVTINAALARQVTLTTELAVLVRQQASVQAAIATATAAQTAATTAQATAASAAARAQTGLNTAYTAAAGASSVASRAIGLLGGPIGIITTLLGLGASAWILWGNSAEEAADKAANGVDKALRKMVAADVQRLNEVNAELSKFQGGNNSANDAASIRFLTEKRKALQASIDEGRKTLDDQQRQQDGQDMLSRNYKPRRTIAEVVDTSTVSGINNRIKALKDLRDAAKIDSAEFQRYEKEIDSLEKKLQEIGVKKGPKAKEDKPDVLGFDLAKVRRDLDGVTNAFSIAESIMEAQRQAGALGDREYYSAKVSFIEMGRDAQIRALEVENKRLETERGNNTERLNNQKQIADNEARMAILRAQAAGQITVLGIQQD